MLLLVARVLYIQQYGHYRTFNYHGNIESRQVQIKTGMGTSGVMYWVVGLIEMLALNVKSQALFDMFLRMEAISDLLLLCRNRCLDSIINALQLCEELRIRHLFGHNNL